MMAANENVHGLPHDLWNARIVEQGAALRALFGVARPHNGIVSLGPDANGAVDERQVVVLSSSLPIVGGREIRQINLRISSTDSPVQRYMLDCAKEFLRRYRYWNFFGP
jgi:hypothetical protein